MSRGRAKRVLAGGVPRPALDLNFLAMGGNLPSIVSFSRASTAWYFNSAGLLVSAASGAPRFDYGLAGGVAPLGLLIEEQRTNLALYSRDATQSAWTKTNVTAAKNQTGIDGAANSASSLTASAADGTCLQSITQVSTSDTFSVYLKRLTGTGEIDITLDGGSTWQNVTSSLSATAWTRVSKKETVANSSFGIRIVTNGDAVAMDVAQIEAVATATSPIITTSATVTRAADSATVALSSITFNQQAVTIFTDAIPGTSAAGSFLYEIDNGTGNDRFEVITSSDYQAETRTPGGATLTDGAVSIGAEATTALSIGGGVAYFSVNRGAALTATGASLIGGLTTARLGSGTSGVVGAYWFRRFQIYAAALGARVQNLLSR